MSLIHLSTTSYDLNEAIMRGTVIWLFWRKILKLRNYRPMYRIVEIYKTDKNIKSRVLYYFERKACGKVLMVSISKHDGLSFVVAQPNKVFKSPICANIGEFEEAFKKYFYRLLPVLPTKVCVLPGNKY